MLAALETAIQAAIQSAPLAWRPSVASYGGEWDDDITQVIRKFPGVWIAYGGGPIKKQGKYQYQRSATLAIMVGNRNPRAEAATRHGVTSQSGDLLAVGTYQMLQDVADIIIGQKFGLDIEPLEPTGIRTLFNTRLGNDSISVLALECKTAWVETWGKNRPGQPAPHPITAINATYHIGQDPVAADLITLQKE